MSKYEDIQNAALEGFLIFNYKNTQKPKFWSYVEPKAKVPLVSIHFKTFPSTGHNKLGLIQLEF